MARKVPDGIDFPAKHFQLGQLALQRDAKVPVLGVLDWSAVPTSTSSFQSVSSQVSSAGQVARMMKS